MLPKSDSVQAGVKQGPLIIDLDGQTLTSEERALLQDPLVGGVIFFARNYVSSGQLRGLVSDIRSVRPELLLCVDQEGGRVQRFRKDFTALPALGKLAPISQRTGIDHHKLVRMHAWVMATELRENGLDFSFTPVVDIDYAHNAVIGDRAFGSQPPLVTDLALNYVHELKALGMAAVAKHFPGHGYVTEDTHVDIAKDNRTKEQILAADGRPFRALIDADVAGIMPAHVVYPKVDAEPAAQSACWIQKVLRTELGFEGAVIGDDLGMAGAAGEPEIENKVAKAISAGCDLLMVCNDRQALIRALDGLHHMNVDHLARACCARRHRLSLQQSQNLPVDFSLEYARQVFS